MLTIFFSIFKDGQKILLILIPYSTHLETHGHGEAQTFFQYLRKNLTKSKAQKIEVHLPDKIQKFKLTLTIQNLKIFHQVWIPQRQTHGCLIR